MRIRTGGCGNRRSRSRGCIPDCWGRAAPGSGRFCWGPVTPLGVCRRALGSPVQSSCKQPTTAGRTPPRKHYRLAVTQTSRRPNRLFCSSFKCSGNQVLRGLRNNYSWSEIIVDSNWLIGFILPSLEFSNYSCESNQQTNTFTTERLAKFSVISCITRKTKIYRCSQYYVALYVLTFGSSASLLRTH